ncbi:MAG TPA: T9SS type A sorting domain-containing protein [Bacteroidales bacterium]|jgi:hypothetical protein|nr:T9SS type A sorting domain-containing protein [Bacteroidales bacterium]HOU02850.1 T9SS type A sorting domain-containing protein [Bacteroidales bacterium]HQK68979.1 T9SS type A sorting domain-containing protein [Bacteroidales bacterium]
MKQVKRIIYVLLLCCLYPNVIEAQEGIVVTGGTATGSGGNASYSLGQVVYYQFTGTGGFIIQGVQQPWEISVVTAIENTEDITLDCMVYPNPTQGSLKLSIGSFEDDNMRFQLYNISGILIQDFKIEDKETIILMDNLRSGIYLLKVIKNNLEDKVFKILKK